MEAIVLLPLLTEADPRVSADGSIDPLGTYAIADALAVRMIPGVRERQQHPRFLTAIAVSHILCDEYDGDVVASDGVSEPWQVFEWYLVEGLVRTESDRARLRGLAGQDKAASSLKDKVPLSAKRYLKTPTVFGLHGIYRALAREIELERAGRLCETGYRLVTTWEAEQGLAGFVGSASGPGADVRSSLRDAIEAGLKQGATDRSPGWQGWTFFRDHLGIYSAGEREARVIAEALLESSAGFRGEVLSYLVSPEGKGLWGELSEDGRGSERAFHAALRPNANEPLGELLDAIASYEHFCRLLEDAFAECLSELSRPQRRVQPAELAKLKTVKEAASSLEGLFPAVRDQLSAFGEAVRFVEHFDEVSQKLPPDEWATRLFQHHARIQLSKPPAGKSPWVDVFDDGTLMVRSGYMRDSFPGPSDEYVHAFRTVSLWSFAKDLRLVN
jgi:hypothetical protein